MFKAILFDLDNTLIDFLTFKKLWPTHRPKFLI